ncbi:methionine synthase vitamin-B12 independent [Streptomyces laurentii]|uniref:Methionine synthase vitamin-B12 independent n=1 Tax=Streptomyces laurentii TaxID=39478 RepID=A0A169PI84_STRLU|nr:methionine synthase vitamin-B12 independent [Streptomyces laurentii]
MASEGFRASGPGAPTPGLREPVREVFVGVTDPCDPRVETAEEVRDRVLRAARYIPVDQADDRSTSREVAFAKIRARVKGTKLAAAVLAGG